MMDDHTKTITALANFLSELYKDGYLVTGEEDTGLILYSPNGSAIASYQRNFAGSWTVEDLQHHLKDMDKRR